MSFESLMGAGILRIRSREVISLVLVVLALWLLMPQGAQAQPRHDHSQTVSSVSPFEQDRHSRHCLLKNHPSMQSPHVCPHENARKGDSRLFLQADCGGASGKGLPAGGNHSKDFPAMDAGVLPVASLSSDRLMDVFAQYHEGPALSIDPPPRL